MDEAQIQSLFQRAVALGAEARQKYLDSEVPRGTDDRRTIDSLLGHAESAPSAFLGGGRESLGQGGPDPSKRIGPYRLVSEIGRGGQGIVWLAEDTKLGRHVALKLLPSLGPGSEEIVVRFRREALIASRLQHPGLCTIYDAATEDGVPYIAMQYLDGEPLSVRIAVDRAPGDDGTGTRAAAAPSRRPWARPSRLNATLKLIEAVAHALHAVHEAGIIHRDIKPGNIMVGKSGDPVLMDFGLARGDDAGPTLTRAGDVLGTPAYMPPEHIARNGSRSDRRCDVWSLGVTLFEAVAGERPFSAPTREGMYRAIMNDDPPDVRRFEPAATSDLKVVIATALEKNPDRRYQTALALAEDLRRVREHEPILARPIGIAGRIRRWVERKPAVAASLGSIILILAAALGVAVHLLGRARQSEIAATSAARDARREASRATYTAAFHALAGLDGLTARSHLEKVPEENRGFEWRHQAWIADRSHRTLPCDEALDRLAFIPGGLEFLTVSRGGKVTKWDAGTGDRRELPLEKAAGRRIRAFDPVGRRVAVMHPVAILDPASGVEIWRREDLASSHLAAFSPDGRILVVHSGPENRIQLLDAAGGAEVARWPLQVSSLGREHFMLTVGTSRLLVSDLAETWAHDLSGGEVSWKTGRAGGVLIDRGGELVAILAGSSFDIVSSATGETLWSAVSPAKHTVTLVIASPDASLVASGEANGAVILRNARDGTIRSILLGHTAEVRLLSFSSDGGWLLSHARDGTIKLWRTDLGEEVPFFEIEERMNGGVIGTRSGRVAAGGWGWVEAWDAMTGRLLWTACPSRTWIHVCSYSLDGTRLAAAGDDRRIHILDGEGRRLPSPSARSSAPVHALAWTPGGTVIAGCSDGSIWSADGESELTLRGRCAGAIRRLAVTPDGRLLAVSHEPATAGADSPTGFDHLDLWELPSWTRIPSRAGRGRPVRGLAFSKDGERLATGDDEGRVCLWDLRTGSLRSSASIPHRRILGIAFSPDGTRLALTCDNSALHIWDLDDAPPLIVNRPHADGGTVDVGWVGDSLVLVTATGIHVHEPRPTDALCVERARARAASDVVRPLQAMERLSERIVARLQQDKDLPPALRDDALAWAQARGNRVSRINSLAWGYVLEPGAAPEDLGFALRGSEIASREFPEDSAILNTLGVAQFRAGRHADALATLERCDRLNHKSGSGSHPIDLLVMAMAHARRGDFERARTLLKAGEDLAGDPRFSGDLEVISFRREAVTMFVDR